MPIWNSRTSSSCCKPSNNDDWLTWELEHPFGRGINFQIELSDIAPLYERLKAANHPFFRDVKDVWYDTPDTSSGQREFLIQDPDGYLLRFCQALGEKLSKDAGIS